MVRALVEYVEQRGVSRQDFMRRASLSEARVTDGSARFTLGEFDTAQHTAVALTEDEALGLHLGEHTTDAAFDVLGNLVAHAPTLRDALHLTIEFSALVFEEAHLVLEEQVDMARLSFQFPGISPLGARMNAEFAAAGLARTIRIFAGPSARVDRARFEHVVPAYRHEYSRLFEGAERFGQHFTGLEFPRSLLDARPLHHHAGLYGLLRGEARRTRDALELGRSQAERLRNYLSARPPDRLPTMDIAARELGMSVRSLRRRLAEEGVTYRALVQGILEDTAAHVLASPGRSVQEAAQVTGFSNVTTFERAFKQWTGVTPTQFRRRVTPLLMRASAGDLRARRAPRE
jgi:AraC-like DNA-binding protein